MITEHLFFYLGISLLVLHEMDAIRCKEWRILPGLSLLNDKVGYHVFVLAHLPLFFFMFWMLSHRFSKGDFIFGFDIFMVVHFILHIIFLKHKKNEFRDWLSWTIIGGVGLCGLIDLWICF